MYKQIQLKITISKQVYSLLKAKSEKLGLTMSHIIVHTLLNDLDPPQTQVKKTPHTVNPLIGILNLDLLDTLSPEDLEKVMNLARKVKLNRWAKGYLKKRWGR